MSRSFASGLRPLIGGESFLQRKSLLLLFPYLLFTSVATVSLQQIYVADATATGTAALVFRLIAANCFSLAATWALIEVLEASVMRGRDQKPLPISLVLFLSFTVGAFKGATTGMFGLWLGAFQDLESAVFGRWIQAGILGILLFPMLALTLEKLKLINKKRDVLIADKVLLTIDNGNLDPQVTKRVESLQVQAQAIIDDLRSATAKDPEKGGELFSEAVDRLVQKHIRPLSHLVWQEQRAKFTKLTFPLLLRAAALGGRRSAFVYAALLFIPLFMGNLPVTDVSGAFLEAIVISGVSAISIALYARLPRTRPNLYIVGLLTLIVSSVALSHFLLTTVLDQPPSEILLATLVIQSSLALQTFLFVNMGLQLFKEERITDEEIASLFSDADIEARVRMASSELLNRDYAQFLHSEVQNRLLIAALSARNHKLGPEGIQVEISKLQQIMDSLGRSFTQKQDLTFQEIFDELIARWDGFVVLDLAANPELRARHCLNGGRLLECLNEAVSNSVRHGKSSRVSISLNLAGDELKVAVVDDGVGPKDGKMGLGSKVFEEITAGKWKLEWGRDGGAALSLRVRA